VHSRSSRSCAAVALLSGDGRVREARMALGELRDARLVLLPGLSPAAIARAAPPKPLWGLEPMSAAAEAAARLATDWRAAADSAAGVGVAAPPELRVGGIEPAIVGDDVRAWATASCGDVRRTSGEPLSVRTTDLVAALAWLCGLSIGDGDGDRREAATRDSARGSDGGGVDCGDMRCAADEKAGELVLARTGDAPTAILGTRALSTPSADARASRLDAAAASTLLLVRGDALRVKSRDGLVPCVTPGKSGRMMRQVFGSQSAERPCAHGGKCSPLLPAAEALLLQCEAAQRRGTLPLLRGAHRHATQAAVKES